jgi:hypothetical protein
MAKIDLNDIFLIRSKGFNDSEEREIVGIVQRHQRYLLQKWLELHGDGVE